MIDLTPEQRRAAQEEKPLRLHDPETDDTYVLLKMEEYERLKALLGDEEFDARSTYPNMARIFGPAGWDDPAMDVYDELDPRRQ